MYGKRRFSLSDIPDFDSLIQDVAQTLRLKGITQLTLTTRSGQEHPFEVRSHNISFIDHGTSSDDTHCVICKNEPRLRFEFIVTDLHGHEVGPIGSVCIFKNVLGEKENRAISNKLKTTAEEVAHLHQQQDLLASVDQKYPEYLKALGFHWARETHGDTYLQKHLRAREYNEIVGTLRSYKPIPLKVHKKLQDLTGQYQEVCRITAERQAARATLETSPAPVLPANLPVELYTYYKQHREAVLDYLIPHHRAQVVNTIQEGKRTQVPLSSIHWLEQAVNAHQFGHPPGSRVPKNLPVDVAKRLPTTDLHRVLLTSESREDILQLLRLNAEELPVDLMLDLIRRVRNDLPLKPPPSSGPAPKKPHVAQTRKAKPPKKPRPVEQWKQRHGQDEAPVKREGWDPPVRPPEVKREATEAEYTRREVLDHYLIVLEEVLARMGRLQELQHLREADPVKLRQEILTRFKMDLKRFVESDSHDVSAATALEVAKVARHRAAPIYR